MSTHLWLEGLDFQVFNIYLDGHERKKAVRCLYQPYRIDKSAAPFCPDGGFELLDARLAIQPVELVTIQPMLSSSHHLLACLPYLLNRWTQPSCRISFQFRKLNENFANPRNQANLERSEAAFKAVGEFLLERGYSELCLSVTFQGNPLRPFPVEVLAIDPLSTWTLSVNVQSTYMVHGDTGEAWWRKEKSNWEALVKKWDPIVVFGLPDPRFTGAHQYSLDDLGSNLKMHAAFDLLSKNPDGIRALFLDEKYGSLHTMPMNLMRSPTLREIKAPMSFSNVVTLLSHSRSIESVQWRMTKVQSDLGQDELDRLRKLYLPHPTLWDLHGVVSKTRERFDFGLDTAAKRTRLMVLQDLESQVAVSLSSLRVNRASPLKYSILALVENVIMPMSRQTLSSLEKEKEVLLETYLSSIRTFNLDAFLNTSFAKAVIGIVPDEKYPWQQRKSKRKLLTE